MNVSRFGQKEEGFGQKEEEITQVTHRGGREERSISPIDYVTLGTSTHHVT